MGSLGADKGYAHAAFSMFASVFLTVHFHVGHMVLVINSLEFSVCPDKPFAPARTQIPASNRARSRRPRSTTSLLCPFLRAIVGTGTNRVIQA